MPVAKRVKIIVPTTRTMARRQAEEDERAKHTAASGLTYNSTSDEFRLYLKSGVRVSIPRTKISEFDQIKSNRTDYDKQKSEPETT